MKELNLIGKCYYNGVDTYRASEIYYKLVLGPFEGYEFTGEFRPPKKEEYYVTSISIVPRQNKVDFYEPRVILIKSNDDKFIKFSITSKTTSWLEITDSYNNRWPYGEKREFVEPEGYKFTGECRSPLKGEYFLNAFLGVENAFSNLNTIYLIVKKIETHEPSLPAPVAYSWLSESTKKAKITPLPCIMLTGLDLMVHIGEGETAADVYKYDTVYAPHGFEFTGEFRIPKYDEYVLQPFSHKQDEYVLNAGDCKTEYKNTHETIMFSIKTPRLILRKL